MSFDPASSTLIEVRDLIARREISAEHVVRAYLDRIERLDLTLHCFNSIFADRALEQARKIDARITSRPPTPDPQPPLLGCPIAIKDNLCTDWGATTCSSNMLADFRSPYSATVVERLQTAGAIILGKTNLDEFAMGSSTEHSAFGPTRNPWDNDRVAGGSSGGSAAAVAAGLCAAAIGSDTGGSIRLPAAFCGVVGFKPTYGVVSRYGLVAFASSLDQIGPITRDAADVMLLMSVIAGHDPRDSTSNPAVDRLDFPLAPGSAGGRHSASHLAPGSAGGRRTKCDQSQIGDHPPTEPGANREPRLGLPCQYLEGNDPAVARMIDEAVARFRSQGVEVVEIDLPLTRYGVPTYYIIAPAEASSNLARYDGIRYGRRATLAAGESLEDLYCRSRSEGFGDEVQRRIMIGTHALSSGYYDAFYLRALKVRRLIREDFDRAFEQCDAILGPTTPGPAFRIGEKSDDPLQMYLTDIYTVNANLAGLPAVSVCGGFTDVGGKRLPLGLQLISPAFSDARLLTIAGMLCE